MTGETTHTYSIVVEPDPRGGGYVVSVPALPGCLTHGETLGECVANAQEAIALYLGDVIAAGDPVPAERVPPRVLRVAVAPAP